MAGLGSFMEGFAQGGSMRMDWERQNRRRRKEDADFAMLQDDVRLRNRDIDIENRDITDPEKKIKHLTMPEQGEDPFFLRMMKKFGGAFGQKEDRGQKAIENAPVSDAQTATAAQQEGMVEPWAASGDYFQQQPLIATNTGEEVFADGGKVEDEYEKPTYTQALKDRTKEVLGLAPYAVKSNKGDLGKAARALEGRKNKIDRAVEGYADGGLTEDELLAEEARRNKQDKTGNYIRGHRRAALERDAARADYYAADRGYNEAATSSMRQLQGDRRFEARPRYEAAEANLKRAEAAKQENPYAATYQGTRGGARNPRSALPVETPMPAGGGGAPAPSALPTGNRPTSMPTSPAVIDFSQIDTMPEDVPTMNTKDWEQYRAEKRAIAAARGQSVGDVDKEVTAMQMGGFMRYGQQALALMQAGNQRGAMSAMRAAFQYFPNGNDVKLGIHQGQIIGYGMDEETGKPVGKPMVLNADTTARMLENFANPQAWRMWTKDWHAMAMEEKKFDRDTAVQEETLAQGRERNKIAASAARSRAMTALVNAQRNGLKPSDLTSTSRYFSEGLMEMVGIYDPLLASKLAAMAAQKWAANPNVPPAQILDMVIEDNQDILQDVMTEE